MSLNDLASIGSFVNGLAVLISLVFLYFQLRQLGAQIVQAERNQRATIAQTRADRGVQMMLSTTSPSLAAATMKAMTGAADLTLSELTQFTFYARALFMNTEDTFLQNRNGLVDAVAWGAFLASFRTTMRNAGFRLAWALWRDSTAPEFATFVDQLIAETPVSDPPHENQAEMWKLAIAHMTGQAASAGPPL
jgi:hypothetical protein